VSDAYAPPSAPRLEADPLFSRDRSSAKSPAIKSRGVLRRVARRFGQLLLLWLVVSIPIVLVINRVIQPTYEASSLVKIEPVDPQLFSSLNRGESQSSAYLKTEVAVLTSDKVLEPAVANALVFNLPVIKLSNDPKNEIREKLKIGILENTNLIRVALELPNREDAITIVQAVVQSYLMESEAARDHYRATLLDPAAAPRNPSNDKRLTYMAAAPVSVFVLLLGLFLVRELIAGRSPEMRYARKPG
jgi:capsular polysaccharide biosynthesis protein